MQKPYEEALREAIGRKSIKLQEQQNEILMGQGRILEQQSKILQGQQKFTEVLAVATCILAIGTIVHLYFYVFFGAVTMGSNRIVIIILGAVIGGLSGIALYFIFNSWGVFKSKKKK